MPAERMCAPEATASPKKHIHANKSFKRPLLTAVAFVSNACTHVQILPLCLTVEPRGVQLHLASGRLRHVARVQRTLSATKSESEKR